MESSTGMASGILRSFEAGELEWSAALAALTGLVWADVPVVDTEEGAALGEWPLPPEDTFLEVQAAYDEGVITAEQRDEVASALITAAEKKRGGAPKSKGVKPVSVTELPLK